MADKYSSSSGSENGDSRNSSRSSASAEERLRRLFNSCDADGDGFLDGEDFTFMCRMLNLADAVDEIRQQLGMTDQSRISFEDFLRCRDHVMLETTLHQQAPPTAPAMMSAGEDTGVESDHSGMFGNTPNKLTSWPTLSSDSLGALSCTKPESADYDSGARDLSPEPASLTLTQLIETHDPHALQQLTQAGLESCLEIANRLHTAALTSMKGEVLELKNHLYRLAGDRRRLEDQLAHNRQGQGESAINNQDFEQRLEQLTCRYEERIIELHSVIAELRKKVERHQINVIKEEDEYEGSEQGQSIQSNDGESFNDKDENNEISQEFSRVVSEIETDLAARGNQLDAQSPSSLDHEMVRAKFGLGSHHHSEVNRAADESVSSQRPAEVEIKDTGDKDVEKTKSREDDPPRLPPRTSRPAGMSSSQILVSPDVERLQSLESEVRDRQADNEELRRQVSQLQVELGQMGEQMERVGGEREALKKKLLDVQQKLQVSNASSSPSHSRVTTPTKLNPAGNHGDRLTDPPESYPVAKMAELKKLKTCASDKQILGSEVTILGVQSTSAAEHLVQSLQDGSSIAELLRLKSSTIGEEKGSGKHDGIHDVVIAEFEVELERRQARIDHLKAQNDVLVATLEESRSQAESYSILMGKFESNSTALQLAASYSDQCLETQDVLTALLETEMGVLLANCRAAGLGGLGQIECRDDGEHEEITIVLQRAHHARRRMEGVARHLISRLDRSIGGSGSGGSLPRGSSWQPWEDGSTNSRTASTSSTTSSVDAEFTKLEEVRLKEHIQRLKAERMAVGSTVLGIESIHKESSLYITRPGMDAPRIDLENAVLMQELMAVKEEKAELKARSYLLEKEKRALELRLSGKETQEQAFRVQIEHLSGELQYIQQQQQQLFSSSPSSSSPSSLLPLSSPSFLASIPNARLISELQNQDHGQLIRSMTFILEREQTLKGRVSELMSTLEKISRNSESRHKQSSEFVNDLKRANSALISAFDKAKKKYQGRLKKMETQLKALKEKYDLETTSLKHRIDILGNQGGVRPAPNETSL